MNKMFIICVGGTYGAEDFYAVDSVSEVAAQEMAKDKYKQETKKFEGTYLGNTAEIFFDCDGVSQLLSNLW